MWDEAQSARVSAGAVVGHGGPMYALESIAAAPARGAGDRGSRALEQRALEARCIGRMRRSSRRTVRSMKHTSAISFEERAVFQRAASAGGSDVSTRSSASSTRRSVSSLVKGRGPPRSSSSCAHKVNAATSAARRPCTIFQQAESACCKTRAAIARPCSQGRLPCSRIVSPVSARGRLVRLTQ